MCLPLLQELDPRPFTPVAGCFPGGRLVALDAITHPPQLLAVTEARTLHLWDWLHRTSLVAAPLLEEPLSCALHPGGTMALVGSAEQLRLYQLLRVRRGCGAATPWWAWEGTTAGPGVAVCHHCWVPM